MSSPAGGWLVRLCSTASCWLAIGEGRPVMGSPWVMLVVDRGAGGRHASAGSAGSGRRHPFAELRLGTVSSPFGFLLRVGPVPLALALDGGDEGDDVGRVDPFAQAADDDDRLR
jgi:hypothetical protein